LDKVNQKVERHEKQAEHQDGALQNRQVTLELPRA
jgi:hypothetical protein